MKKLKTLYSIFLLFYLNIFACMGEKDEQLKELIIEDLIIGNGKEAKYNSEIKVDYTGWLEDGTEFDSSLKAGRTPLLITLGIGQVIQGWDQGIPGMKAGGARKLTIPPHLGYGNRSVGSIPPNSTLIFEVNLLEVK
ncbi:MAG: peptidylprolyl isomerase [Candidatus Marinimicrobia bacterium]|nr:peptidylprolyl isomerase [Candidatus Neomarinimicrobiota bacterium]|tara:strand:+ start:6215 stop:6625 length:411 start_codon:yes stop_codon:yes gene_type:complete